MQRSVPLFLPFLLICDSSARPPAPTLGSQAQPPWLSLQTVEHGFPHQPSALGYSPSLHILAIGTRSGAIKLYPFQCLPPRGEAKVGSGAWGG